jgi:ERCC4-type nuclease
LDEFKRKDSSILTYLDARYDSSRNALHGTIVMINAEIGEVIHIIIKTQEEAGCAWNIEDLATKEALQNLEAEVVHDDKRSQDSIPKRFMALMQKAEYKL